jgi:hypothetical protein
MRLPNVLIMTIVCESLFLSANNPLSTDNGLRFYGARSLGEQRAKVERKETRRKSMKARYDAGRSNCHYVCEST